MRKRLVLGCSALLLSIFALGSTPASACGGYYGYGYGCGCPGYGYAAYYVPPAYAYYAPPIYRARWSYAPRAYYGWRAAGWRGVGWRGGWRGGRRW
jgi:hypothetical protein